jgi:NADH dehydrogenase
LAWATVHILFLDQTGLRISVFLQWMWTLLTAQRGSRLIVNHHGSARDTQTAEASLDAVISDKRVV